MDTNYTVKINQQSKQQIPAKAITELDLVPVNEQLVHLLHNNQSYLVEIVEQDFHQKTYTLKVQGNLYKVQISNSLDQLIESMGLSITSAKHVNSVKAPMPGLILDIAVKKGDAVKENDTLLILEAMKMENSITSPREGVIKTINVSKGDAVNKSQLLVEFES
ncbi:acetyl-CoA carboxylase biotin carboxyl carrier protein subunit [Paucihalobacter sp.]|uniref:acetyl-CoA carboxylase biotin carboxyl carrier protein subunit n=1 Tax=Paucihalobacter sp. TaxID=2850405 RepID=UPI002FE0CDA9